MDELKRVSAEAVASLASQNNAAARGLLVSYAEEIAALRAHNADLQTRLEVADSVIEEWKQNVRMTQEVLEEDFKKVRDSLKEQIKALQAQVEEANKGRDAAVKQAGDAVRDMKDAQASNAKLNELNASFRETIDANNKLIDDLKRSLRVAEREAEEATRAASAAEDQLADANARIEVLMMAHGQPQQSQPPAPKTTTPTTPVKPLTVPGTAAPSAAASPSPAARSDAAGAASAAGSVSTTTTTSTTTGGVLELRVPVDKSAELQAAMAKALAGTGEAPTPAAGAGSVIAAAAATGSTTAPAAAGTTAGSSAEAAAPAPADATPSAPPAKKEQAASAASTGSDVASYKMISTGASVELLRLDPKAAALAAQARKYVLGLVGVPQDAKNDIVKAIPEATVFPDWVKTALALLATHASAEKNKGRMRQLAADAAEAARSAAEEAAAALRESLSSTAKALEDVKADLRKAEAEIAGYRLVVEGHRRTKLEEDLLAEVARLKREVDDLHNQEQETSNLLAGLSMVKPTAELGLKTTTTGTGSGASGAATTTAAGGGGLTVPTGRAAPVSLVQLVEALASVDPKLADEIRVAAKLPPPPTTAATTSTGEAAGASGVLTSLANLFKPAGSGSGDAPAGGSSTGDKKAAPTGTLTIVADASRGGQGGKDGGNTALDSVVGGLKDVGGGILSIFTPAGPKPVAPESLSAFSSALAAASKSTPWVSQLCNSRDFMLVTAAAAGIMDTRPRTKVVKKRQQEAAVVAAGAAAAAAAGGGADAAPAAAAAGGAGDAGTELILMDEEAASDISGREPVFVAVRMLQHRVFLALADISAHVRANEQPKAAAPAAVKGATAAAAATGTDATGISAPAPGSPAAPAAQQQPQPQGGAAPTAPVRGRPTLVTTAPTAASSVVPVSRQAGSRSSSVSSRHQAPTLGGGAAGTVGIAAYTPGSATTITTTTTTTGTTTGEMAAAVAAGSPAATAGATTTAAVPAAAAAPAAAAPGRLGGMMRFGRSTRNLAIDTTTTTGTGTVGGTPATGSGVPPTLTSATSGAPAFGAVSSASDTSGVATGVAPTTSSNVSSAVVTVDDAVTGIHTPMLVLQPPAAAPAAAPPLPKKTSFVGFLTGGSRVVSAAPSQRPSGVDASAAAAAVAAMGGDAAFPAPAAAGGAAGAAAGTGIHHAHDGSTGSASTPAALTTIVEQEIDSSSATGSLSPTAAETSHNTAANAAAAGGAAAGAVAGFPAPAPPSVTADASTSGGGILRTASFMQRRRHPAAAAAAASATASGATTPNAHHQAGGAAPAPDSFVAALAAPHGVMAPAGTTTGTTPAFAAGAPVPATTVVTVITGPPTGASTGNNSQLPTGSRSPAAGPSAPGSTAGSATGSRAVSPIPSATAATFAAFGRRFGGGRASGSAAAAAGTAAAAAGKPAAASGADARHSIHTTSHIVGMQPHLAVPIRDLPPAAAVPIAGSTHGHTAAPVVAVRRDSAVSPPPPLMAAPVAPPAAAPAAAAATTAGGGPSPASVSLLLESAIGKSPMVTDAALKGIAPFFTVDSLPPVVRAALQRCCPNLEETLTGRAPQAGVAHDHTETTAPVDTHGIFGAGSTTTTTSGTGTGGGVGAAEAALRAEYERARAQLTRSIDEDLWDATVSRLFPGPALGIALTSLAQTLKLPFSSMCLPLSTYVRPERELGTRDAIVLQERLYVHLAGIVWRINVRDEGVAAAPPVGAAAGGGKAPVVTTKVVTDKAGKPLALAAQPSSSPLAVRINRDAVSEIERRICRGGVFTLRDLMLACPVAWDILSMFADFNPFNTATTAAAAAAVQGGAGGSDVIKLLALANEARAAKPGKPTPKADASGAADPAAPAAAASAAAAGGGEEDPTAVVATGNGGAGEGAPPAAAAGGGESPAATPIVVPGAAAVRALAAFLDRPISLRDWLDFWGDASAITSDAQYLHTLVALKRDTHAPDALLRDTPRCLVALGLTPAELETTGDGTVRVVNDDGIGERDVQVGAALEEARRRLAKSAGAEDGDSDGTEGAACTIM